jgi:anti-sigma B factor antagonist
MGIVARKRGDVLILDLRGDVSVSTIEKIALHQKVKAALEGGERRLLVNFDEVGFMDSAGFGELLASFISTRKSGGRIKLERMAARIRNLFNITGLERVFEIFDDEEAAVRSFHEA